MRTGFDHITRSAQMCMCVSFWLQVLGGVHFKSQLRRSGGCVHINVVHVVLILSIDSGASDINCITYVICRLYWNTGSEFSSASWMIFSTT
ncbi:hypothetical protein EDD22DRAFT_417040 [Suillus occidentalis]|nr:hypothetical protein EDD22DRAFT_417040 [Suillus occidentalis]